MDDDLADAARTLAQPGGAWASFVRHYVAHATHRLADAARNGAPLDGPAADLRAIGLVDDAIAAAVADTLVKATAARRRTSRNP